MGNFIKVFNKLFKITVLISALIIVIQMIFFGKNLTNNELYINIFGIVLYGILEISDKIDNISIDLEIEEDNKEE